MGGGRRCRPGPGLNQGGALCRSAELGHVCSLKWSQVHGHELLSPYKLWALQKRATWKGIGSLPRTRPLPLCPLRSALRPPPPVPSVQKNQTVAFRLLPTSAIIRAYDAAVCPSRLHAAHAWRPRLAGQDLCPLLPSPPGHPSPNPTSVAANGGGLNQTKPRKTKPAVAFGVDRPPTFPAPSRPSQGACPHPLPCWRPTGRSGGPRSSLPPKSRARQSRLLRYAARMHDAVRISGRWIQTSILQRLTARTPGPKPPPRRELLRSFCRQTDWRNRQGELCLSSANVGLKRLEAQGLVRRPPPEFRSSRAAKRQLLDDGQPLPPVPTLPPSVEQICPLEQGLDAPSCLRAAPSMGVRQSSSEAEFCTLFCCRI